MDPFISTVYSGDPARLSLRSVFPAIHAAAADAGGLGGLAGAFIRGRIAARKAPQSARSSSASLPKGSSGSLEGGLAAIPAAVCAPAPQAQRGHRVPRLRTLAWRALG